MTFFGRTNWLAPVQSCNYTKKSAEERLGIEKPKRPLTPFFKFMTQMRPAILAKNPGISSKEAISWTSKHWQQLDLEVGTYAGPTLTEMPLIITIMGVKHLQIMSFIAIMDSMSR